MKLYTPLLLLFIMLTQQQGNSQTTQEFDYHPCFTHFSENLNDNLGRVSAQPQFQSTIDVCIGEPFVLKARSATPVASNNYCSPNNQPFLFSIARSCDGLCLSYPAIDPIITYTGQASWSHSVDTTFSSPTWFGASCVQGDMYITITPMTSGMMSFQWTATNSILEPSNPNGSCSGNTVPPIYEIRNVSGSININVVPDPVISLSSDKTVVNPGEAFSLFIEGCDNTIDWDIKEICETRQPFSPGRSFRCSSSSNFLDYEAPNYTTTLKYRGYYRRATICSSAIIDSTNEIVIQVVESPVENACNNDPSIDEIDNLIISQEGLFPSQQRSDYHIFESRTLLSTNCSVEEVWIAYLSSNTFAQPQHNDMPTELTYFIPIPALDPRDIPENPNLLPQTMECEDYDIVSLSGSVGKVALLLGTSINLTKEEAISSCPELSGVKLSSDPIKIVIDGNDLCVTRYTRPGHIFHPGKTTTCFEVDNCGDIYIVTRGKGATVCGDGSEIGNLIAGMNTFLGKKIFDSNHGRFTCSN